MAVSKKRRAKRRQSPNGWGSLQWLKDELGVEGFQNENPIYIKTTEYTVDLLISDLNYIAVEEAINHYSPFPSFYFLVCLRFEDDSDYLMKKYFSYLSSCKLALELNSDEVINPFVVTLCLRSLKFTDITTTVMMHLQNPLPKDDKNSYLFNCIEVKA